MQQKYNIRCTMRNKFLLITWMLLLAFALISLPPSVRCVNDIANNSNSSTNNSNNNIKQQNQNNNATNSNNSSSSIHQSKANDVNNIIKHADGVKQVTPTTTTIATTSRPTSTMTTTLVTASLTSTASTTQTSTQPTPPATTTTPPPTTTAISTPTPTSTQTPALTTNASTEATTNDRSQECNSIDIRNTCAEFNSLNGCTVIRGSLSIVLMGRNACPASNSTLGNTTTNAIETCDFDKLQFPLLREITEYLLLYDLRGVRRFKKWFPNLTVIRGQRLFLHYALIITTMPELERIEFPSLLAIQNGAVFITRTPKLCQTEKINWSKLTKAPEENYFSLNSLDSCPNEQTNYCHDGKSCWSSNTSQLFEQPSSTADVTNATKSTTAAGAAASYCQQACLGGCLKGTTDCFVCRHLTAHGKCVEICPPNTYLADRIQRCLTHDECAEMKHYKNGTNCVRTCPNGYMRDNTTYECIPCPTDKECIDPCQPPVGLPFTISTLQDAENLEGCHTLNGTLVVVIRNPINEQKLKQSFADLRVVTGHVKVADSTTLTSLEFLGGLRRINGQPLESGMYSLIVYGNTRLRKLWHVPDDQEGVDLHKGGIYVHRNHLLCNTELYSFREQVLHNRTRDSLQLNDEAVLCAAKLIDAQLQVLSNTALSISWPRADNAKHLRVLWHELPPSANMTTALKQITEEEDGEAICRGDYWERRELLQHEINSNDTHYNYTIDQLKSHATYVVLLKTFSDMCNRDDGILQYQLRSEARSALLIAVTKAEMPTPPIVLVVDKTNDSLTLRLVQQNRSDEEIDHYQLYVYELPDANLEKRNFCNQPPLQPSGKHYWDGSLREDIAECCTRKVEAIEDATFIAGIHEDFGCSKRRLKNCKAKLSTPPPTLNSNGGNSLFIKAEKLNSLSYKLTKLRSFTQYALMVQACTKANTQNGSNIICGSYSLHSERTNYTQMMIDNDLMALRGCWSQTAQRYYVYFNEPATPNVLYYIVHFLSAKSANGKQEVYARCLSRQEHRANHYQYGQPPLNYSFHEVMVRIFSLATDNWSATVPFDICNESYGYVELPLQIAGTRHGHGVNVFLVCFLLGAGGTALWVCYKRRYWRKCPELKNCFPRLRLWHWRALIMRQRNRGNMEDRMVLVDGFETVRFHNSDDDEHTYLE